MEQCVLAKWNRLLRTKNYKKYFPVSLFEIVGMIECCFCDIMEIKWN